MKFIFEFNGFCIGEVQKTNYQQEIKRSSGVLLPQTFRLSSNPRVITIERALLNTTLVQT